MMGHYVKCFTDCSIPIIYLKSYSIKNEIKVPLLLTYLCSPWLIISLFSKWLQMNLFIIYSRVFPYAVLMLDSLLYSSLNLLFSRFWRQKIFAFFQTFDCFYYAIWLFWFIAFLVVCCPELYCFSWMVL